MVDKRYTISNVMILRPEGDEFLDVNLKDNFDFLKHLSLSEKYFDCYTNMKYHTNIFMTPQLTGLGNL